MLKPHPTALACLASSLALLSCAAPKAEVVAENPAPQAEKTAETAVASEPAVPAAADDGIRLPDMLGLPGEGELRSTSPAAARPTAGESGAVIARPPAQPPAEP
ncbi:MAG: hypothetical protein EHM17_11150 [Verrucomicrobiaceae bacterium]|jgi:hypothetical protein|nr:MAG: hypothetical protein EHM17_11150 [Verrucomicrobiaceae bacterium]